MKQIIPNLRKLHLLSEAELCIGVTIGVPNIVSFNIPSNFSGQLILSIHCNFQHLLNFSGQLMLSNWLISSFFSVCF